MPSSAKSPAKHQKAPAQAPARTTSLKNSRRDQLTGRPLHSGRGSRSHEFVRERPALGGLQGDRRRAVRVVVVHRWCLSGDDIVG